MERSVGHSRPATKLYDHIQELKMRLLVSFVTLVVAGCIVYLFYEPILALLRSPLGAPLYYNSPAGSFSLIMKICFMGALIITIPVIIYNLIMFIRPAFEQALPRKRIYLTTGLSTALAIAGAIFAFTVILPGSLRFFADFQVDGLNALISADNYLGFVTNIIIMFIVVFQVPLLIIFIDSIKPLSPNKLLGMEKWVILGSLVVALLAPFTYDLVTSLLIALPIVVLYNLSIVLVVAKHAIAAHNAYFDIHSTVIGSAQTTKPMLDDRVLEGLICELYGFDKDAPAMTVKTGGTCMDIKPLNVQQKIVEPAAWVKEREQRRIALSSHVRVFSDISRTPHVNRVLTSQ